MNRRFDQWDNKQIVKAYRLLFTNLGDFSIETIKNLKIAHIKTAYRLKAKETHPDKSKILGVDENLLTKKFTEITDAYQNLCSYLEKNKRHHANFCNEQMKGFNGSNKKNDPKTSRDKKNDFPEDKNINDPDKNFYPRNYKLLFGQYLYYSGNISFKTLLDAIVWQRRQRAQYGKIALEWGILKNEDIIYILNNRNPMEKFGESAVRLGLINPFQHTAILIKQRKKQRYIGEFFIKNGFITLYNLHKLLKKQEMHNNNLKAKNK